MNEHEMTTLSDRGRERRDAMLDELRGSMRDLHRTRRMRRSAIAVVASLTILVVLAIIALPGPTALTPGTTARIEPAEAPAVRITIVQTDPTILARYAATPTPRVRMLDDEALLDALDALGRPAGLVRSGGRAWLTANVTSTSPDDEFKSDDPPL
jgi:hypothetical protein